LWPDGRFQELVDASQRAINSGELQEVELHQELIPGQPTITQVFVVPEFDSNANIIGTIATSRNITAIRESELRLKHTIDSLPGLAYTLHLSADGNLSLPFLSPNVETTIGIKPQDATRNFLALHNLVHPDDRNGIDEAIAQSAKSMQPIHIEYRLVRPLQQERWVDMRAIPEAQNDGGILWYGIMLDITKRKQAEAKLQASEQRFRTLTDNLPDNVARFNLECKAVYANPPLQKLAKAVSGKSPIGRTPTELLKNNKDARRYQRTLERVMETGKPASLEVSFAYPPGELSIHQMNFVAERRGSGEIRGALVIGRDITVLKETERRLKESNIQIRAMARRRETAREEERKHISRELHDDLGQYLTALSLHTSALNIEFAAANPAMRDKLELILELVSHTRKVARNLSRKLRPVELDMGIESALNTLVDQFSAQYGIQCELELGDETHKLPDNHCAILYRVLQESLTNIARHAEAQHVGIVLRHQDDSVVLEVSDDGLGFNPSKVKLKSFGLVGMRERLQAEGGELEIRSEPNNGTRIIAHLPKVEMPAEKQND
jgi:PAS domain S-box-containing protein